MQNLESFSTKELVEALKSREGVEVTIAEPYQDVEIKVNGPAIVLTVID
ncbi:MAG: BC1881 family protein [Bacteroidales bacterium]|nr:BC1881 family protein [Bacteroidales bacterium]